MACSEHSNKIKKKSLNKMASSPFLVVVLSRFNRITNRVGTYMVVRKTFLISPGSSSFSILLFLALGACNPAGRTGMTRGAHHEVVTTTRYRHHACAPRGGAEKYWFFTYPLYWLSDKVRSVKLWSHGRNCIVNLCMFHSVSYSRILCS